MTRDEFWVVVDRVHAASGGNMPVKCRLLEEELKRLSALEVGSFAEHFGNCYYDAYRWDLWGAAFVICGGCGDDGFMDFRSSLISMGRKAFESALADPDSLAETDIDAETAGYEGYQYAVGNAFGEMKCGATGRTNRQHPEMPEGTEFDERVMSDRYPRLTAKFGYVDMDPAEVERQDEEKKQMIRTVEFLFNLLIDSGIIPPCGLIPPVRVVRSLLRRGEVINIAGGHTFWPPTELDELAYWMAVRRLEALTPAELEAKKINANKFELDLAAPAGNEYGEWIQSLKERGLVN